MKEVSSISITFPAPVELNADVQIALNSLVSLICDQWQSQNPGMVMWASGNGCQPIWKNGDIAGFDENTFSIACSARKAYDSERIEFTPEQVEAVRQAIERARQDALEWRRMTRVSREKMQEPLGSEGN